MTPRLLPILFLGFLPGLSLAETAPAKPDPALAHPGVPPRLTTPVSAAANPDTLARDLVSADLPTRERALHQTEADRLAWRRAQPRPAPAVDDWWGRVVDARLNLDAGANAGTDALGQSLAARAALRGDVPPLVVDPRQAREIVRRLVHLDLGPCLALQAGIEPLLPELVAVLAAQEHPFYQAVLLRALRLGLDQRLVPPPRVESDEFVAVPPPAAVQAAAPSAALVLAPGQVEVLRRGLESPSATVRRETVRILGHGQAPLALSEWTRLAMDPDFFVAAAAVEWAGLLLRDDEGRDPEARDWAEFCAARLGADALALTRSGAEAALDLLAGDDPREVLLAVRDLPPAARDPFLSRLRPSPAIVRLRQRLGLAAAPPPASATPVDFLSRLPTASEVLFGRSTPSKPGRPLPWTDPEWLPFAWTALMNRLDEHGEPYLSGSVPDRKLTYGAQFPFGFSEENAPPLRRLWRGPSTPVAPEDRAWLDACARMALSRRLPLAAGAIRALRFSDREGARAVLRVVAPLLDGVGGVSPDAGFAADLLRFHPAVGALEPGEVPTALWDAWARRAGGGWAFPRKSQGTALPRSSGLREHIPVFLFSLATTPPHSVNLDPESLEVLPRILTPRMLPLVLAHLEGSACPPPLPLTREWEALLRPLWRELTSRKKVPFEHPALPALAAAGDADVWPWLERAHRVGPYRVREVAQWCAGLALRKGTYAPTAAPPPALVVGDLNALRRHPGRPEIAYQNPGRFEKELRDALDRMNIPREAWDAGVTP